MQPAPVPARLKRHMKVLLAAIFALALASLPVEQAAACSCMQSTPKEAAEFADAVFAGTVIDEQPVGVDTGPLGAMAATLPAPAPFGQVIYTFEVDGVAKGPVGTHVEILAGGDGAMCGMSFGLNERWLVFTTWDGAVHSTGLCSGNVPLEAGAEAPLPLTAPAGADDEAESFDVPVAALVLIGIIGIVAAVSWLAFRRGSTATPS
jgi:hypothetical protein